MGRFKVRLLQRCQNSSTQTWIMYVKSISKTLLTKSISTLPATDVSEDAAKYGAPLLHKEHSFTTKELVI